jgi:hypothetical protein
VRGWPSHQGSEKTKTNNHVKNEDDIRLTCTVCFASLFDLITQEHVQYPNQWSYRSTSQQLELPLNIQESGASAQHPHQVMIHDPDQANVRMLSECTNKIELQRSQRSWLKALSMAVVV